MENLTPMMQQYHRIKLEHPELLLFFRLGDFYEMFYEDAVVGSRELEITLTSRNNDRQGNPIPMCGIPHHALGTYSAKLLRKGYKLAICEQVEDPRQAKGIVRREVTRILTPGTASDEVLLDARENNYLACICEVDESLGVSFLDLSTGEFWASEHRGEQALEELGLELSRFLPREVVMPEKTPATLSQRLTDMVPSDSVRSPLADWVFNPDYARRQLLQHFQVSTLDGFGLNGHTRALSAAGSLLYYVRETQKCSLSHITGLRLLDDAGFLKLDESTVRNLELVQGIDGNRRWTLLASLDRTRTGMGARLLRRWMLRPGMDLPEIRQRLDSVDELIGDVPGLAQMSRLLSEIQDVERLLARVTMGTANPRELLALRESLRRLPELIRTLSRFTSKMLTAELDPLEDVVQLLEQAIDDEAPISLNEGRIIRSGFNEELDELRSVARSGKSFIAALEASEREKTGISSLKVRYNRVFGYFIEVTRTHLKSVPEHYIRKQTLAGSERYVTPELKEYEEKVLGAEERIVELEKVLFQKIRESIAEETVRIQQVARTIAVIDVLVSFAEVSRRNRYVRPLLDESRCLEITAGRHPVLELQSGDPFVPNDLQIDADGEQLMVLTGPNMGGKSTYLRQNALIVVMAQMGCFVPAERARIGLVDQIFTRVGASDNLARGQSTFMVEMVETARILNTATPRSLVLLDEVGRGTATFDGLSIAWSVAEFLATEESRRARTLFATHYQELTRLERLYPAVRNYCVAVSEGGKNIIFFHKVLPGVASKSYGIEVARLAGVPAPVIERAKEVLRRLEKKQLDLTGRSRSSAIPQEPLDALQKALF